MCYGKSDPELELMTGKIVNHFFVLKPSRLDEMLRRLDNSELSEFAEPLLDHLWGASLRFVPDALLWNFEMNEKVQKERLKLIDKWRLTDWREVIRKKKYWNDEDYFTWKSPEQRCALNALEK